VAYNVAAWAVWWLGIAACLACVAAAVVDWQVRQSCLVWWRELTAGQMRSASECIRVVALHRQTQNSPVWHSGQLNSHRHTKHDKTVVSGMVV